MKLNLLKKEKTGKSIAVWYFILTWDQRFLFFPDPSPSECMIYQLEKGLYALHLPT